LSDAHTKEVPPRAVKLSSEVRKKEEGKKKVAKKNRDYQVNMKLHEMHWPETGQGLRPI